MVSTRKKKQSNRRLVSQLDELDQDIVIGNAASRRQENVVVNESTNDRDFTIGISNNNSVVNENVMNVKNLERCFNERIDREMSNIVDTVEDRIQNAILTAIDNIVAPKNELAIRSLSASSGRDATSVSANSELGEHVGINASFENASGSNNILRVSNVNDETRHNIPNEVSEMSVPETHFDRQAHTHHTYITTMHHWHRLREKNVIFNLIGCVRRRQNKLQRGVYIAVISMSIESRIIRYCIVLFDICSYFISSKSQSLPSSRQDKQPKQINSPSSLLDKF